MAAPRPYRLELEAFEERTLPSGGFGGNDNTSGSRGWDATPARTRTIDDPRAGPGSGEGRGGTNAERVQTFAAPQVLALMVVADRPTVAPAREVGLVVDTVQQAAAVVSAVQNGGAGAQMPPSAGRPVAPDAGVAPSDVRPDRQSNAAPPGGASSERAPAPIVLMFSCSNEQMAFDGSGPVEPIISVVEPSVAPAPRPTLPPLHEWLPIEIDIPVAVPLAGLLRVSAEGIEAGAQRLLELTTGIEVEGDAGGWWLWLAAGAALAGGAGYTAWTNRRAVRGESDDARIG